MSILILAVEVKKDKAADTLVTFSKLQRFNFFITLLDKRLATCYIIYRNKGTKCLFYNQRPTNNENIIPS